MRKRERDLRTWLHPRGWSVQQAPGGHLKLTHPAVPRIVFTSATPSDQRGDKNMRREVINAERNAGLHQH